MGESPASWCPGCGRPRSGAGRFCAGCGAPVPSPVAVPPAPGAPAAAPAEPTPAPWAAVPTAPAPAPARRRSRWPVVAVAVALVIAVGVGVLRPGSAEDPSAAGSAPGTSSSPSSSASPSTASPSTASSSTASSSTAAQPTAQDGPLSPLDLSPEEQLEVVRELEERRAQAFAEQDADLLREYYADEGSAVAEAEGFGPDARVEVVRVAVNGVDGAQILADVSTREPGNTGPQDHTRLVIAYGQVQLPDGSWEWRAVDFFSNE